MNPIEVALIIVFWWGAFTVLFLKLHRYYSAVGSTLAAYLRLSTTLALKGGDMRAKELRNEVFAIDHCGTLATQFIWDMEWGRGIWAWPVFEVFAPPRPRFTIIEFPKGDQ